MNLQPLTPFGVEIAAPAADAPLESIPRFEITTLLKEHRLAVLRGFSAPAEEQMLSFCRELGTILEWEFGAVNELQVREEARNYLYTNREVPFHWDGAFLGKIPHYIFFHCPRAPEPGSGGETTFCDTPRLLADVPPGQGGR